MMATVPMLKMMFFDDNVGFISCLGSLQQQAKNSELIECIKKFEKHDDSKIESIVKTILAEKRL